MPSPLSGFTQPAASPTSAQFRPATPETAPPMGSSAEAGTRTGPSSWQSSWRGGGAGRADRPVDLPLRGAGGRVGVEQRPELHTRRPPGRGEGADADVHLAAPRGTEWKDPAVAGEQLPVGSAQLQVRGNPFVVAAPGPHVTADGHAVGGVPVPLPAEHPPQGRARTVGDHEAATGDGAPMPVAQVERYAADQVAV